MDNPKLIKHLEQIGLTDKSALIYAYLLQYRGAYPVTISRATKLNRSTVYKMLMDLVEKDLIVQVEREKKLYYFIDNTNKLLHFTKQKIKTAEEQHEDAERLVPFFTDLFASDSNRPKFKFFEGTNALEQLQLEILSSETRSEILAFSNIDFFNNQVTSESISAFVRKKERFGLKTREILPDTLENRNYSDQTFLLAKKNFAPKIRFVPSEKYPLEVAITLFGSNKIATIKPVDKGLSIVVIEDEKIYKSLKAIFELAWLQASA